MATKKRKVDSECRAFNDEWTWKYFFTVVKDRPVCLICNEAVTVFKEYNISRHFTSKHKNSNYEAMSEYERKQNVESLCKKLSGRQNFFKKVNTIQEAATHASYIVAYNIDKNNKALSDGEFVKQCMLQVCDVLCPDKKNNFQTVSLSRKMVTSRIEAIDKNLTSQLESNIGQFKFCFIAMDESTDINDTSQLELFIRGADENFEITEELACMRSLKGTTKGCDIFREFQKGLLTLKVPITNIYALCKYALNMKPVLDAVVKLVNTIRSRGLTHRQFRDFLQSVQSEYSDVLYYTKVRWLSAGCDFERVWQLKDDILSFFHEKQCSSECKMLEDTEWLSDFAFFTDLLCHMNNLNVKM
ncbi:General transcription factor II-I repeat domain-containing protein 2B [Araneus ventricosus]|uniref:General transcription factor II-I repeat domain-containing protein 2B n=1 Tax=Araneus ventricosus TaxID=182803 RepID=A0A4Y2HTG3_ARAVE|nr:General transcription factor II-I repeat domain-containing protein 2B [Araneus ventricosus]